MTLYVQGKSKKAINELLAKGRIVIGFNPSPFGGGGEYILKQGSVPEGTVIKVYEKIVGNTPYPKAYGTWEKNKIK